MNTNQKPRQDYTHGDHSFKSWFKHMWHEMYIQLFVVFFTMLVLELINIEWCVEVWLECSETTIGMIASSVCGALPMLGVIIVAYKGFFQYWKDLINGTNR